MPRTGASRARTAQWLIGLSAAVGSACVAQRPVNEALKLGKDVTFWEWNPSEPEPRDATVDEQIASWKARLPEGIETERMAFGGIWWTCALPEHDPCLLLTEHGYADSLHGRLVPVLADVDGNGMPDAAIYWNDADANRGGVTVVMSTPAGPREELIDDLPQLSAVRAVSWERREDHVVLVIRARDATGASRAFDVRHVGRRLRASPGGEPAESVP